MKHTTKAAFLSLAGLVAATSASAGEFETAMTSGEVSTDFRLRYELVDSEAFNNKAEGLTLRSRLGYTTGEYKGFQATAQIENVTELAGGDYNDGVNGNTTHPTIADPASTEINELFVTYKAPMNTMVKVGRQAVNFDNERFIGEVDFRQNNMTHDAAVFQNTTVKDLTATYAFVNRTQTVTGGDITGASHLLNASYAGLEAGTVTAYGYLLDLDNASANSTNTFGVRFAGDMDVKEGVKAIYEAEYAYQSDAADNASDYNADYYHVAAGAEAMGATVKLGYEVKTGDGANSFVTPLGTGHKFNGWSDVITDASIQTAGNDGLEDLYVSAKYASDYTMGTELEAAYHVFEAENGSSKYGKELNLGVSKEFNEFYNASVQFASYDADDLGADQDKIWLTFGAKF